MGYVILMDLMHAALKKRGHTLTRISQNALLPVALLPYQQLGSFTGIYNMKDGWRTLRKKMAQFRE